MTTDRMTLHVRFALFLALAIATRVGAQTTPAVSTEFDRARDRSIVTMEKVSLDHENELGAFYEFPGQAQRAPVTALTLHLVRSGAEWAYLYDQSVVLLLDDKTRLPLTRAQRTGSVGEGYVLEQIFIWVSPQQASQIAQAHKVEMKVGGNAFLWSDALQGAFRQMVAFAERRDDAPVNGPGGGSH